MKRGRAGRPEETRWAIHFKFSRRQAQVTALRLLHLPIHEAAEELGISEHTARRHDVEARRKADAKTFSELARKIRRLERGLSAKR